MNHSSKSRSILCPTAFRKRDEDGQSLIEAVVAVLLMSIALAMTVIIVGVLTKNVANTTNTGTSADGAESAVLTLASYVNGAVSPTAAAEASLNPSNVSNVCWGSGNVSPEQGTNSDGWSSSDDATQVNESVGIVYAHDFAMEVCGYGGEVPGTSSTSNPYVYLIYVNTATGNCTANNYCPLDIVNLTPFNATTQTQTAYSSGDYPTADIPSATPPVASPVVGVIGRVWCDQACQQLGVACSSMSYAANSVGLTALPPNYTSLCPAGYSGTPPLFSYYTSAGLGSPVSPNPSLNWTNAYTDSTTSPANVVLSPASNNPCVTNATTFVAASCGPMDMYSPVDAQTLQNIQCVVLNMTVLGQDNPSSTTAKSTSVNITDQVWLRNLSQ